MNSFFRWSLLATLLASLTAGGIAAYYFPIWKPFKSALTLKEEQDMRKLASSKSLDDSMTVLVLGTDVVPSKSCNENGFCEPSNSLNGRSDTIMLARFEPKNQKVNIVSVPRDSRVPIPGFGKRKINEANLRGGAVLAAQTVSNLFGDLPIDRYVRINPLGVVDLVNSLGGVRVYVKKPIHYQDDSQHLYIDFPQGWQTLSGIQAQQYMRFRHDELGDIGRVQRQQEVIRALADKALQPATLARMPDIFEAIRRNVDTNLSVTDLLTLAKFGLTLEREKDLRLVMLPGRFSYPGEYSASYWVPNKQKINLVTAQYLGWGEMPAMTAQNFAEAAITLQNATGENLSQRKLRRYFREQGFNRVEFTKDYTTFIWRTEILPQQGDLILAEQIKAKLGIGEVKAESTGQINSDITIRIGKNWPRLKDFAP